MSVIVFYPTFTLREGVFFNEELGEWEVWIDGEAVAWIETDEESAWRVYWEMAGVEDVKAT